MWLRYTHRCIRLCTIVHATGRIPQSLLPVCRARRDVSVPFSFCCPPPPPAPHRRRWKPLFHTAGRTVVPTDGFTLWAADARTERQPSRIPRVSLRGIQSGGASRGPAGGQLAQPRQRVRVFRTTHGSNWARPEPSANVSGAENG